MVGGANLVKPLVWILSKVFTMVGGKGLRMFNDLVMFGVFAWTKKK